MNTADRKTLRRVAAILKREADSLRESHTRPPAHKVWVDMPADQFVEDDHDEMLKLSRLLRAMALRP